MQCCAGRPILQLNNLAPNTRKQVANGLTLQPKELLNNHGGRKSPVPFQATVESDLEVERPPPKSRRGIVNYDHLTDDDNVKSHQSK
jgi:hypothetical protein